VPGASLRIEPGQDRDGLDEGRLAATVLADEKRHPGIEAKLVEAADRGDRERVLVEGGHPLAEERHRPEEPATAAPI